jgi:hypothetical protein
MDPLREERDARPKWEFPHFEAGGWLDRFR